MCAYPMPRLISQRLTGTVKKKAIASESALLHQKSQVITPAFIAPGINHSSVLSMASIDMIEIVSVVRAVRAASRGDIPILRAPRKVRL